MAEENLIPAQGQVVNVLPPSMVNPPGKFNFIAPETWPQWRKRFERFMTVSGQNQKSEEEKINILVYIMGEEAEEILLQFANQPTTFVEAIRYFENHFIPRRNVIFERFKFNSRTQKPGESMEAFITSLHSLAEYCEYGTLKEELIRDRIVVGMLDKRTSERLQLQAQLTLGECIIADKQAESQASQSRELHGEPKCRQVASLSSNTENRNQQRGKPKSQPRQPTGKHCYFCGLGSHSRDQCPAAKSTCKKCRKIGHWASVCRSSKVRAVQVSQATEATDSEQEFVGSITINHINTQEWTASVFVSKLNKVVDFLIDTGSDITCLPSRMLSNKLVHDLTCGPTKVFGPSGEKLKLLGILHSQLRRHNKAIPVDIYVIQGLTKPILGKTAVLKFAILKFNDDKDISLHNIKNVNNFENTAVVGTDVKKMILQNFPKLFGDVGKFKTEMEIKIREGIQPFAQSVPRVVPIPLLKPLKEELDRLIKLQIIEPVDYHTAWVSPIVVVQKHSKIRLCVDYTRLNKAVLRTYFPIGKVETILAKLQGSKYFSKLDTASGFYQIRLKKESQSLTTFITPFGRFLFKRVPFGITCAPEYFSLLLNKILQNIDGVISHIDDILIHAKTIEQHDEILNKVLKCLEEEGLTLNKDKCVFRTQRLVFLGHEITDQGISIDSERIKAIVQFPEPTNKKELLQFLGMVNFCSRFLPNRSHLLEPLTSLLKKDQEFLWDLSQKESFKKIKHLLQRSPCLAHFDLTKSISVSADASSFGLGACLIQTTDNKKEIVCYASRLLSNTEKRYAQIEREALALTWACDKFHEYITGIPILIETDQKPLVQVLQTKPIDELTPRLQRFRIRLMRYDYKIYYTPGKELVVADALSRNFSELCKIPENDELTEEVEAFVNLVVGSIQVKPYLIDKIKEEQNKDVVCNKLKDCIMSGWPSKQKIDSDLQPYYQYRFELSLSDGLILRNSRILIPESLQLRCLELLHQGHLGIVKCRARAKNSVWWIGLSTQIENSIRNCPQCVENRTNPVETFVKDAFPDRPWQKIALDLFKTENWYLIVTDYYSRFFEIFKLKTMTESVIISKLKELFARYGIPELVRSDNGPQFQNEFRKFALEYDFKHVTSSPYFPQSNGCVEAAVKCAKNLIKKNDDIYLALLAYRTSPLSCGYSPSELLMNRKLRNPLPMISNALNKPVCTQDFQIREERMKDKSAEQFNTRHRTRNLSELSVGDKVWITDLRAYGTVTSVLQEPRSYLVLTDFGTYRRNRWHLVPAPYYRVAPRFVHDNSSVSTENCNDKNVTDEKMQCNSDNHDVTDKSGENKCKITVSDVPASGELPVQVTETDSLDNNNLHRSPRPTRNKKQPLYLKDYVCNVERGGCGVRHYK